MKLTPQNRRKSVELPAAANPVRFGLAFTGDLNAVVKNRMLSCDHYDTCLTFAVASQWANFTCRHCELFKEDTTVQPSYNACVAELIRLQSPSEED